MGPSAIRVANLDARLAALGYTVHDLGNVEVQQAELREKALLAIGTRFLALARGDDALGALRAIYGVAGVQPEACQAFYREGPERVMGELAAYLRRAHAAGTLKVRHPPQAADLFLSMFFGSAHMRGLLKLEAPDPRENRALLREAVRVFMAAYGA